jgi:hypothetical protein
VDRSDLDALDLEGGLAHPKALLMAEEVESHLDLTGGYHLESFKDHEAWLERISKFARPSWRFSTACLAELARRKDLES